MFLLWEFKLIPIMMLKSKQMCKDWSLSIPASYYLLPDSTNFSG